MATAEVMDIVRDTVSCRFIFFLRQLLKFAVKRVPGVSTKREEAKDLFKRLKELQRKLEVHTFDRYKDRESEKCSVLRNSRGIH